MHRGCANLRGPMDWNDLRYFLTIARGPAGLVLTAAGKNMLPIVEDIAEQI